MTYPFTESEDFDAAESWPDEAFDDSFDDSAWEARGRRRPQRPAPTAKGISAFRGRGASSGTVTQAQLEASLARVRQEIRANATGIKTLDGRMRTAAADHARHEASTRRQVDKLRADLKTTQTLSALIPLIAPPGSRFGAVAPLMHLVGSDLTGGGGVTTAATPGPGGLLSNTNALFTIGALLYASGALDTKAKV